MAKILAVGIATLDIINTVSQYPNENDEIRSLSLHKRRGGNATNTLTILSQLGHNCHWAGILVNEPDANFILDDLKNNQIDITCCAHISTGKMPTSYITMSQETASRTIVHYRDCPEYSFDQFKQVDLSTYDWIHFEGRNITDTHCMLEHVNTHYPGLPLSLEVEKARTDIATLFSVPSILMFSQHYALTLGFDSATALLNSLPENTVATCTWGADGAWARNHMGKITHSSGYSPNQIIDTLGAGDTFNAGLIHCLINDQSDLGHAINYACQLAGHKCGQQGFTDLMRYFKREKS